MKLLNKLKSDRKDLINNLNENIVSLEKIAYEQQVEIERLQGLLKEWKTAGYKYADSIDLIKTEAIKEFSEKFNSLLANLGDYHALCVYEIKDRLDIVKNEMVGDDNA